MNPELYVQAVAAAGAGSEALPEARRVALRERVPVRKGGRLPNLGLSLARAALGDSDPAPTLGVLFGTNLGCQTETESFLAHLFRAEEATPKPRAFSASVHNAIASFAAQELGARGECSTFVHGELSFAWALFAAARATGPGPFCVGAVDELPRETFLELARAGDVAGEEEGGALCLVSRDAASPMARIASLAFGRPDDPEAWARAELADDAAAVVSSGGAQHASSLATRTALAAAILAGESSPAALGLDARAERIALLEVTPRGECALIALARA